jgi:hypothetical protein
MALHDPGSAGGLLAWPEKLHLLTVTTGTARRRRREIPVPIANPPRTLAPGLEGVAMTEEPIIIQMIISHYSAMLKLNLDDEKRSFVNRLIAEAEEHLALAILEREQQRPRCERELSP